MREFYRITNEQMKALEVYMDEDVKEEVHFKFASCTNEEFLVQVILRNGLSKDFVEEVLEAGFWEIERTLRMIDTIKSFIQLNNIIQYTKIVYPNRELCTEYSEKGTEYRWYLNRYATELESLKKQYTKFVVLSDLKEEFPEVDYCFESDRVFYTWMGEIL